MNPTQNLAQQVAGNEIPGKQVMGSQIPGKEIQGSDIPGSNQPNPNQAAVSQALGILNDKSMAGQIGKAIATPNYAGYCLQWTDDQLGTKNRQPTAIADYESKAMAGKINGSINNIPKDAKVYWNADNTNGGMGHVGLSNGDGTFTAATDNGIKTFTIQQWEKYSGQQFIGWAKE